MSKTARIIPIRTAEVADTRPAARSIRPTNRGRAVGHFLFRSRQPVVRVESVIMRGYQYQGGARRRMFVDDNGNAQSLSAPQLSPYVAPPPVFTDWLAGKKIALLLIEGSARALDCIARYPGARASQYDFVALRQGGFAVKPELARYHQLTAMGQRIAGDLLDSVANEFGLHHITNKTNDYRYNGARCTCGWHHTSDERYGKSSRAIEVAIARHLADPQAWIRARERSEAIIKGPS